jgi:nitrite reductase (NADH) small subunit
MPDDKFVLQCPWHGWEYDVETGRCLTDPDHTRVRVYQVKINSARVWVGLD